MDVVPDSGGTVQYIPLQNLSNPDEEVDDNAYENPGTGKLLDANAIKVGPAVHTFS